MKAIILIPLALLTGCNMSPNAPGTGGVTRDQAVQLNQAAADLDARANEANTAAN